MKTIIFEGELNNENVQELVDELQQPYIEEPEDDIVLYFSSKGGYDHSAEIIIDCINSLPEERKVKIVFYFAVYSAAFNMFIRCKCKKVVKWGAIGLVHLVTRDVGVREAINDNESFDKFLLDNTNDVNEEYLKWIEGLDCFTPKELKELSKGRDVFLNSKKLKKILKNQK